MEYVICLKWGGLHGHILLQEPGGNVLYVLRRPFLWLWPFPVVGTDGEELFCLSKTCRLGSSYEISSKEGTVAAVRSNYCWLPGVSDLAERAPVHWKYGWFSSDVTLREDTRNIATIRLKKGFSIRATLRLEDAAYDTPAFLVACAMIFHDSTRRG